MPHRALWAAVAILCAAVVASPCAEARQVDPFTGFIRALSGQPTRHRVVTHRKTIVTVAMAKKQRVVRNVQIVQTAKAIPEITVRPLPKDIDRYALPGTAQSGMASWYGPGFHGRPTACGAIPGYTSLYNEWRMTAAHKTLKCGTVVEVHSGGKVITVTITDRGPYVAGRIIDLSRAAAERLGMMQSGTARVTLYVLGKD